MPSFELEPIVSLPSHVGDDIVYFLSEQLQPARETLVDWDIVVLHLLSVVEH